MNHDQLSRECIRRVAYFTVEMSRADSLIRVAHLLHSLCDSLNSIKTAATEELESVGGRACDRKLCRLQRTQHLLYNEIDPSRRGGWYDIAKGLLI